jgi:hypothetical protein
MAASAGSVLESQQTLIRAQALKILEHAYTSRIELVDDLNAHSTMQGSKTKQVGNQGSKCIKIRCESGVNNKGLEKSTGQTPYTYSVT